MGVKKHRDYMADFNLKPWPDADLKPLPDEDEEKDADEFYDIPANIIADKGKGKGKSVDRNTEAFGANAGGVVICNGILHKVYGAVKETIMNKVYDICEEAVKDAFEAGFNKGKNQSQSSSTPRSRSPRRVAPPSRG